MILAPAGREGGESVQGNQRFRQELVALLPRLRRFATSLAHDPAQADDLVQAACEKALSRRHQFSEGTRLDSWMYRIVQTTWIDELRAASRRRLQVVDCEASALELVPDHRPQQETEAILTLAAVRRAMATLPDQQQVVLALVCVEGLSYREAGDVLGVPIGTVMSRLARARLALTRLLQTVPENEGRAASRGGAELEVGNGTI